MTKKFKRILIANRGEISRRVARSCRYLGIESFSLYTDKEKELPHVLDADYSICLGEGSLAETYLNIDKIVKICKEHNIDAIHPGYGFLSENAKFSKICEEHDIKFIGASAGMISKMGDKATAKATMKAACVPCVPGSE